MQGKTDGPARSREPNVSENVATARQVPGGARARTAEEDGALQHMMESRPGMQAWMGSHDTFPGVSEGE